jgi:hypothetical protein
MIRKILTVFILLNLSGCTLYNAIMMTGFDGNEYQLITQIRVDAAYFSEQCGTSNAPSNAIQIARETDLFEKYSEQLPHNDDSYKASKALNTMAKELDERYKKNTSVSNAYCKLKYSGIENSAKLLQHVLGNRPR